MAVIFGGLVVFGCIIFITITLLSFTGQSASLETQLEDVKTTLAHKKGRLEDYRIRAEQLQETVPDLRTQAAKLQGWIAALNRQKIQRQSESKTGAAQSLRDRDVAIQRSLAAVQKQKRKG